MTRIGYGVFARLLITVERPNFPPPLKYNPDSHVSLYKIEQRKNHARHADRDSCNCKAPRPMRSPRRGLLLPCDVDCLSNFALGETKLSMDEQMYRLPNLVLSFQLTIKSDSDEVEAASDRIMSLVQ